MEASRLKCVQAVRNQNVRVTLGEGVDNLPQLLLADDLVHEGVVNRKLLVEDRATQRGFQNDVVALAPAFGSFPIQRRNDTRETDTSALVQVKIAVIEGHAGLGNSGEHGDDFLAVLIAGNLNRGIGIRGQVEQTDDHVLRRHGHGASIRGLQNVVGRQHEDAGFSLRLCTQRQVNCHLVTVEVSVEGATSQTSSRTSHTSGR